MYFDLDLSKKNLEKVFNYNKILKNINNCNL